MAEAPSCRTSMRSIEASGIETEVWDTVITPCDCCGQVVAKQLWVVEVEATEAELNAARAAAEQRVGRDHPAPVRRQGDQQRAQFAQAIETEHVGPRRRAGPSAAERTGSSARNKAAVRRQPFRTCALERPPIGNVGQRIDGRFAPGKLARAPGTRP